MKNEYLSIQIADKGSELISIKDETTGFEYLWQADPEVWARHAPILFPIVGKLKDNSLLVNGQRYPMSQHGFARDQFFQKVSETTDEVWYELASNDETKAVYPFSFTLRLGYQLTNNTLTCLYEVTNNDSQSMYFSIGAHPGFNLPTAELTDYTLIFEQAETEERHLLSGGLFNGNRKKALTTPTTIQLNTALFNDDAIVFKNLQSNQFTLKQHNGTFKIRINYSGFPHMGIWAPKGNQQFICLEPWCGHADPVEGHDDVSRKEGIVKLEGGAQFNRSYALTFGSQ
ncbi:MAG: aldose 1-epimerase family protein [Bacteroidota bacterium]